ncbi:MAG TPA: VacJ family lipoprotein [Burkholderiaceae bacterium]|nr:VacJ family lipoprotein [Burkholderiaceae bacterium]
MLKQASSPSRLRLAASALLVAGCLGSPAALAQHSNPDDPLENMNRAIFSLNDKVDRALIKPVTLAYTELTPKPVRSCIGNIFGNLRDVWSAANSFLQAQGHDFFNTLGRVLFNSTMGLGGCIDVASRNGAHKIPNDLGITLGVWGLKPGPYLVLPGLGPSTLRDGTATVGGFAAGISPTTPLFAIDNVALRNTVIGLYAVNVRADLLSADRTVDDIALDRYSFVRDAYLQRRQSQVNRRRGDDSLPDYDDDLPDYEDDLPDYNED